MGCNTLLAPRNCCLHTLHWRSQNRELRQIDCESKEVIWFSTSLWSNDEVGYKDAQTNPVQFMSAGLLLHLLNFHLPAGFWWLDFFFFAISTCQLWRKSQHFSQPKGRQWITQQAWLPSHLRGSEKPPAYAVTYCLTGSIWKTRAPQI